MPTTKRIKAPDDKFREVLTRLEREKVRCVDVETSGLDWRVNHIVGYVLAFSADPRDSYYLPFRHAAGGNLFGPGPESPTGWNGKVERQEAALIHALDQQGTLNFGHNLAFDLKFLHRVGYRMLGRHEDTIINAPLLDEFQTFFNLEFCCQEAGVAAKKSKTITDYLCAKFPEAAADPKRAMGHFWRLRGDDLVAVEYATGDGTSTWQLRDWQMPKLAYQNMMEVHDIESRLIPILARMSIKGIKVDEDRLEWLLGKIADRLNELGQDFAPYFPPNEDGTVTSFNPRSPKHVQEWCGTVHGRMDWPYTAGRMVEGKRVPQPSFPESWLETHEPGQKIVALRQYRTLRDSFAVPLRDTHLFKGRVHTEYNQLRGDEYGTVTGRLSSSNPNMQAIPKRNVELGRLLRSVFVPDKGMIWGSADYAQIEPVLLAHYSRDPVLVEGYMSVPQMDAHASVTRAMNDEWRRMPDEQFFTEVIKSPEFKAARNIGKRVNQTLLTGGGAGVLGSKYKVKDAEQVMREYFRRMPGIRQFQKVASSTFERRKFLVSLLGRRARLQPGRSYTAVNRLLQCGNADVIKWKMVQIDDYLESEGRPMDMLNNIHDDLAFQFPKSARKHYDECLRIMSDFSEGQLIELDIPLGVDHGEGKNWAIATYGEEDDH